MYPSGQRKFGQEALVKREQFVNSVIYFIITNHSQFCFFKTVNSQYEVHEVQYEVLFNKSYTPKREGN